MEAARSSVLRRVKREFAPERISSEILALAFERLTGTTDRGRTDACDSVQAPHDQGRFQTSPIQEVMR